MDVRLYSRGRPAVVVNTTHMPGSRKFPRSWKRLSVRFLDGQEPTRSVMSAGKWKQRSKAFRGQDADFWHDVARLVVVEAQDLATAQRVAMRRLQG